MNILVVLGHPNEDSFNHAIAQRVIIHLENRGHEVVFHDLHKEKFNPIIEKDEIPESKYCNDDIEKYCNELKEADGIIVVHPNWWGQPPAILKGWIDRVFRPGIAYTFKEGDTGEGVPVGLLKAKTAIVFNTSNTSPGREQNIFLDPLETLWKNCIFHLCGVNVFYRKIFSIVVNSSEKERISWLREVDKVMDMYF